MKNVRRILCPVDFSDCSQASLDLASLLAREDGSKLFIVYVEQNPFPYGPAVHGGVPNVEEEAHDLFKTLPAATNVEFEHDLLVGDPVSRLIEFIQEKDVDLVVMGSHGRTGLSRALIGSVAEHMVRQSPVPVLTVKMNPRGN